MKKTKNKLCFLNTKHSLKVFLIAFISIPTFLLAQNKIPEYGNVSREEVMEVAHPKDTSAEAAILYDIGKLVFDDELKTRLTVRVRIKIYKKTGFNWAEIYIPYNIRDKQNPEYVTDIKAYSYCNENGNLVRYDLNKKDIFKEKRNEYYDVMRFTIPNVKQGSVIEYEYTKVSSNRVFLPDWYFQSSIPVNWSEYNLAIPGFYTYQMMGIGFQKFFINDYKISDHEKTYGDYKFTEGLYRLVMKDVPAFKNEPFITSTNDYIARIEFQLSKYEFPQRVKENYMNTWESLIEKVLKDYQIGDNLGDKAGKEEAIALTKDIPETEPLKKAKAIYEYVQKNFKYKKNMPEPVSPKKLMLTKEGDEDDIHVLLCNMLRHIGLQANLVLISTRSHGRIKMQYPLLGQFNYSLVIVSVGQDQYLLDATNPYLIFGMLPAECINEVGLVLEKTKGSPAKFVSLEQPIAYSHRSNTNMRFNKALQKYEANVAFTLQGYASLEARQANINEEKFKKSMQLDSINKLNIKNVEDITKAIEIKFQTPQEFDSKADIVYLELPFIHADFKENPFKNNERLFPVDFTYKRDYTYILNLEIPEGFQLEDKPLAIDEKIPGDLITFKLDSKKISDNLYQLSFQFKVNRPVIDHKLYQQIKDIYSKAVAKMQDVIVLKKIK